jgi:metal-responsive CopG/Arc/MetJ family transcriptional regulator
MSKKIETKRIDIRVPVSLLREIEEYQENQGIANRTTALLELARKGLKASDLGKG